MKVSTLFTGSILLFLVVFLAISLHYPAELRVFPWLFIIPGVILGFLQLIKDMKTAGEKDKELKFGDWIRRIARPSEGYLPAACWICGLLLSLYLIGFLVAIPLFTVLYLRAHGESWRFSLTLSVVGWGILFAAFALGLKMTFYQGILFTFFS